jgi:dCMP deaminase
MNPQEFRDREYLRKAFEAAAEFSTDPSTQNGAVIVRNGNVILSDANHFPARVKEIARRWEKPGKYFWVEHAERNVIYKAAKLGVIINGATMYMPWFPCADCARAIIQAGILRLVSSGMIRDLECNQVWNESQAVAEEMLTEAEVEVIFLEGLVGGPQIRFFGQIIDT